jgi:hypothetical protein
MADVNYKKILGTVLDSRPVLLEDLNVALFIRIPGETNPAGAPSPAPVRISGMKQLADETKPAVTVTLQDEKGQEVAQKVPYDKGVKGGQDLVRNFDPNKVVLLMESADPAEKGLGLLLRLLVKGATLDALRQALAAGKPLPPDLVAQLQAERARVGEALSRFEERFLPSGGES